MAKRCRDRPSCDSQKKKQKIKGGITEQYVFEKGRVPFLQGAHMVSREMKNQSQKLATKFSQTHTSTIPNLADT